ncbi:MAG: carboxylesterase family protein [Lachnospiraceae bacterium]
MEKQFACDDRTAVVDTDKGRIRGYQYKNMSIFKGVPYAQAKRFHRPVPVEAWEGIKDATNYGYVCPLLSNDKPQGELRVPHRYWPADENCQNLNIWTPACDGAKRSVMFWLHGGGYYAGSSIEQLAYEGENMCAYGDVVVVSINHRLNIAGYFDVSDFGSEYENSGNAGGDDIIAALRWTHDNIAKFGGDPDNIIVFGQSGGGAKVTTLLQTPDADGLFAKGINMSGVIGPVLADSTGSGRELAEAVMKELGISSIVELENAPWTEFVTAYNKVKPEFEKAGKYVGCTPHPNRFYKGEPVINGFRPENAEIPMMIGSVFGEFASFTAPMSDRNKMSESEQMKAVEGFFGKETAGKLIQLFTKAYPMRQIVDIFRLDYIFRSPEIEYIRKRAGLNNCTYSYLFNLDQPIDGGSTPWHCSDIPYVFHNTELVPSTQRAGVTERIEKEIFESVMSFARTGRPGMKDIPDWTSSTGSEEYTMIFDEKTRLAKNFDHELQPVFATEMGPKFAELMSGHIQH